MWSTSSVFSISYCTAHTNVAATFQDNKISHIEGEEDDRKSPFAEVPLLETLALDGNEIR